MFQYSVDNEGMAHSFQNGEEKAENESTENDPEPRALASATFMAVDNVTIGSDLSDCVLLMAGRHSEKLKLVDGLPLGMAP